MDKYIKDNEKFVPKLRFPEFVIDGQWVNDPLNSIANLINERAGASEYIPMSVTPGVGLISQKDKFGREIAGEQYKNYYVIRKGDFAYNKSATKLYPEGYITILKDVDEAAVPNSIFTCFRTDQDKIYPPFLDYLFQDNFHGKWLRKFIEVGGRAHGLISIDPDILLKMPIVYPNPKEQQKIADCLSSLDDLITSENQKLEALKAHKKGLMQNLFPNRLNCDSSDEMITMIKEKNHCSSKNQKNHSSDNVPKLRFKEFENSGDWEEKRLDEICVVNPAIDNLPEHFIYVDLESVEDGVLLQKKCMSLADAPSRAQRLLKFGDVIFQMVRPYQKNNFIFYTDDDLDYVASTGYAQLRAYESEMYLYQYLHNQNFVNKVLAKCTGSNYPAINSNQLSEILIVIPKLEEQQKIADCLYSLDDLITAQSQKIEALKEHKKGLMQGLFPKMSEL